MAMKRKGTIIKANSDTYVVKHTSTDRENSNFELWKQPVIAWFISEDIDGAMPEPLTAEGIVEHDENYALEMSNPGGCKYIVPYSFEANEDEELLRYLLAEEGRKMGLELYN